MKDNVIVNNICTYIKEKIMSKELFPGYRIVEEDIAEELGVSRTPLRRALAQLQYEGFLEIAPNRGTFVIKPTYEEIDRVYEARACIEEGLAKSIIQNVTPEDIRDLRNNYYEQVALVDNFSMSTYSVLNRAFHMRLAAISSNEYLKKYVGEIHNRILIFLIYYDNSVNNTGSTITHAAIIKALENRDLEALTKAIRDDAKLGNTDIFKSGSNPINKNNVKEKLNLD